MQYTPSGKFTTQFLDGRTLFFRFAGRGVVFICCRINAAFSFSPPAVVDVADMADGVAVSAVVDGVAVAEGGATVTAVGDMLVAEFGRGITLGGTLGGGTSVDSVDIFVRGGLWRRSQLTTEFDYHPRGCFLKLRRYPGLFF